MSLLHQHNNNLLISVVCFFWEVCQTGKAIWNKMQSYVFLLNSSSVLTVSVLLIIATYAAYKKRNIQHWVVAHSTGLANFLQWTLTPLSFFFCISLSVSFFRSWKIKQKQEEIANLCWRKFKEIILFFLLFCFCFFVVVYDFKCVSFCSFLCTWVTLLWDTYYLILNFFCPVQLTHLGSGLVLKWCQITSVRSFMFLIYYKVIQRVKNLLKKINAVLISFCTRIWFYLILLFLINYSVIGSFSVLVVSIVRWRHLNEQVSRVLCQ